jgi:hypothetical protein
LQILCHLHQTSNIKNSSVTFVRLSRRLACHAVA